MNCHEKNDGDPFEDELLSQLLDYEEQLLCGLSCQSASDATIPEELRQRIQDAQSVVRLLAQRAMKMDGNRSQDMSGRLVPLSSADGLEKRNIGRFQIRGELGQGGFGIVLLAYDPNLRREVALKIPRFGVFTSGKLRERFLREAWAAAGLDHPNIVPVYEAGEDGGICYIVSAYCRGTTLAKWLNVQRKPVPTRDAAILVAVLGDAVQHSHSRGILHRDLKPANILLETRAELTAESEDLADDRRHGYGVPLGAYLPRVTDFGLAKLYFDELQDTHSGELIGTTLYMAPEQANGRIKSIGPHSDVYSLGAILYELLTGVPPLVGGNDLETLQRVLNDEPLAPRRKRPGWWDQALECRHGAAFRVTCRTRPSRALSQIL